MKMIVTIACLLVGSVTFGQRTYNVEGVLANFVRTSLPSSDHVTKLKMQIIVTDTTYTVITFDQNVIIKKIKGRTDTYQITKKVNDNYFKITDGLKEYFIRIENSSPIYKRFTGSITQENDKGDIFIMFYK